MMRRLRLLVATATGAAVLLTGASLSAASATTAGDDISGVTASGTVIPTSGDTQASIAFQLRDPLGTQSAPGTASVSAEITPPGKSARAVSISYSPPTAPSEGQPLPTSQSGSGSFTIGKDDPTGDWTLNLKVSRGGAESSNTFSVTVSGDSTITGATVDPNPVNLQKGKEVKVSVSVSVKDATSVSAQLVSDDTNEYYDLGSLQVDGNGYYSGETFFSDDTAPGDWKLEVTASRGGRSLKGVGSFTVNAPSGGSSKKTKARATITAPAKVTAGKAFKVSGKVYRGSKAYKGKVVEVYFKKKTKGAKYKLIGLVKATSTGKFAKSVKQKADRKSVV